MNRKKAGVIEGQQEVILIYLQEVLVRRDQHAILAHSRSAAASPRA